MGKRAKVVLSLSAVLMLALLVAGSAAVFQLTRVPKSNWGPGADCAFESTAAPGFYPSPCEKHSFLVSDEHTVGSDCRRDAREIESKVSTRAESDACSPEDHDDLALRSGVLSFRIQRDGTVTDAGFGGEYADSAYGRCLERSILKAEFGPSDTVCEVRLPMRW